MKTNIIYNENCLPGMSKLPDESVDLVITSPPYNLGGDFHTMVKGRRVSYGDYRVFSDNIKEKDYQKGQIAVINECMRILKKEGNMFYFHKNRIKDFKIISPYEWLLKINWLVRQEIVWDTTNEMNQDRRRFIPCHEKIFWLSKNITYIQNVQGLQDCWKFRNKVKRKFTKHPATFPVEVVMELVELLPSARIILNCYMGTGTTAIACKRLGRNYIGFEISKEYCNIAKARLEAEKTLWD